MRWYVAQVMTGEEIAVQRCLARERIHARVPQERVLERKRGQWKERTKVLIPGYVFVGSELLTPIEYYAAKKVASLIRFLGTPTPESISTHEALQLGLTTDAPEVLPLSQVQRLQQLPPVVVSGPLVELQDKVTKWNWRQKRARVTVDVLGEEKYIDFSFVEI